MNSRSSEIVICGTGQGDRDDTPAPQRGGIPRFREFSVPPKARALVHLCQEPSSICAIVFHGASPFAATGGSVADFDRHEDSEREIPNDGKSEARSGNLTARCGNV